VVVPINMTMKNTIAIGVDPEEGLCGSPSHLACPCPTATVVLSSLLPVPPAQSLGATRSLWHSPIPVCKTLSLWCGAFLSPSLPRAILL
jgi:hypothetical protein